MFVVLELGMAARHAPSVYERGQDLSGEQLLL